MFTDEKLSYIEHTIGIEHPNNTYSTPVSLPSGGKYFVFISFQPQDAYGVTFTKTIEVEGNPSSTFSKEKNILESSSDGIASRLTTVGDKFITGVLSMGFISLTSKGHSLDSSTIQNQYGYKAHLFLIGSATKEYFHIYPEIGKDRFEFHVFFKKADRYQGRLMVMIKKKLHTFLLTINVLEGSTEEIKKLNDSHSDFHTSKTASTRN